MAEGNLGLELNPGESRSPLGTFSASSSGSSDGFLHGGNPQVGLAPAQVLRGKAGSRWDVGGFPSENTPLKMFFFFSPMSNFILNIISDSSMFFQHPKQTNLKACHNSNEKSGQETRNNNVLF